MLAIHLVGIETVKIKKRIDKLKQMIGRALHIAQIELLTLTGRYVAKQFDVSYDRTQRSLDIVRNGQHKFLLCLQKFLGTQLCLLELHTVVVAA